MLTSKISLKRKNATIAESKIVSLLAHSCPGVSECQL